MNYKILLPPITNGTGTFEDSIDLSPEDAAPLLEIGVIQASGSAAPEAATVEVNVEEPPGLVNINQATLEELVALDYIGDVIALKIINNRPYDSLDAARSASGLARDKWKKLEPLLTL